MPTFNPPPKSLLIRHRQLAPNASVRVSPLCLGTMSFGESQKEFFGEITKATAFEILDTFYANGGNFIDTSSAYQNGEAEQWLGEWMADRGNRDEIVCATKYTTPWRITHTDKIQSNFIGNGSKSMKLSIEGSLKKLQTSYIDIFYVHWWDYTTSIPELMHSLNDLVVAGKVLYLGISDCPAWIVSSANQYARCHGLRPFVLYQGMWNASMRDFERDIIPMCQFEGMGLAPYGVLGQGRFQTAHGYEEREKHNPGRNFIPTSTRDKQVSAELEKIAKEKECKLVHVALAYCMQKTPYVFPVVGVRKVEHIQDSIDGLRVDLTPEDVRAIDSSYPFDHGFPHTFLSGTLFSGSDTKEHRQAYHPGDVQLTKEAGDFDWVGYPKAIRPARVDI